MAHRLLFDWRGKRPFRELVADCEAFVTGRLAERVEDEGAPVPPWSWTNLLAHGSETDLRSECGRDIPRGRPIYRNWRRARVYLAAEVLALAEHDGGLESLQEQVLRPLELDLAARPALLWQPSTWATHVASALAEHRRAGGVRPSPRAPQHKKAQQGSAFTDHRGH